MSRTDDGNITDLKPFEELPEDREKRLTYEKELKDSQALIDRIVKDCVEDRNLNVWDEKKKKEYKEKQKKEREERYKNWY